VLNRERPIVLVADPGLEVEAAMRLGRIGFDHVAGYLVDGMRSLESRPDLTATTDRYSAALAAERIAGAEPPVVVDVRSPSERSEGAIPGSVALPLSQLLDRMGELPRDRELLVYCAGGYRSSIAASLLAGRGFHPVTEMAGGISAWESDGLPLTTRA
jgi:rhodanese-related sulfurtransferase